MRLPEGRRSRSHSKLLCCLPAPKRMKRPATQRVKPGIKARVKHPRGEEDLRHASLQDFWDED
ncbi:hypothetical protein CIT31_23350 [Mesorhizobium wenxiniae]|uniref:Uncharacterized protein n=1 Tax=Mesorhizobium wenxiniae TaxID=2014805 RepID=A0A271KBB6_9HYPH|nr:hypothetical protein CIT31_23350 [Mesorhizobium wenxiniae]